MVDQDTVSLKEFFEEKFKGIEEKIKAQGDHTSLRFDSLDVALTLAREDANEKYDHLNKLRQDVEIDRGVLQRKDTCKQQVESIENKIEDVKKEISILREAKSQIEGRDVEKRDDRTQSNWSTGLMVVAIMSGISIIIMVLHLFGVGSP